MSGPRPVSFGLAGAVLAGAILTGVISANAAWAEDGLTFDLSTRLFHDSNPGLLPHGSPSETNGALDLSFALNQETEVSKLAMQGSLGLLDTEDAPASDPALALTYDRLGANADFHVDAA
ncbi:MAG: hypothetical protein H7245_23135, partial [Candidatus Saccharibacteria bacterium]|nr:hypothetical protein [Pseudorhodobacter sp.]